MLLGGLDETIWPPETRSDAFLNRPMRAALGLSPPERKIGQTAHDFAAAMGAPRVILVARKNATARRPSPRVSCRGWQPSAARLSRPARSAAPIISNLPGRSIARAMPVAASQRPMPRPPLALRPTRLSVTRIETLRRDPYAIYAEFILRLNELPPLAAPMSRRIMGMAIHDVLANFCQALPGECAAARSSRAARRDAAPGLRRRSRRSGICRFRLAAHRERGNFLSRLRSAAARCACQDRCRNRAADLDIPLDDGSIFTLSAKADRLEHRRDGTVGTDRLQDRHAARHE